MALVRRYAFLMEDADGERTEYETTGEQLSPKEAISRAYDARPDSEIVKVLRGHVPDQIDLSPPADGESEEAADEADGEDDGWVDWNEEDWLELDYKVRESDVLDGRVDDNLDEIEEVETSATVEEAVADRREELDGQ